MKPRFTFSLLIFFFAIFSLNAKHIIGGTVAYEVINQDESMTTLNIDFILYRNSGGGGANFDQDALVGVYGLKNNNFFLIRVKPINLSIVEPLNLEYSVNCPELFYEKGTYTFDVRLPNSGYDSYVIAYQRCCREDDISNIVNATESGFALTLTIYPNAFDYTEKAKELETSAMPFLLDNEDEHVLDLSIDDVYVKDYKLTRASVAGGTLGINFGDPESCLGITPYPGNCPPPYDGVVYIDEDNPYGVGSEVNLNNMLGELSVKTPLTGIFLFEMTVDRYMEGELLSSINNQWTTTTAPCIKSLSTDDDSSTKEVKLAPNPSCDMIHSSNSLSNVLIFDAFGKQVMSVEKLKANEDISTASLNTGAYILKGMTEYGELITLQFVKSVFR